MQPFSCYYVFVGRIGRIVKKAPVFNPLFTKFVELPVFPKGQFTKGFNVLSYSLSYEKQY